MGFDDIKINLSEGGTEDIGVIKLLYQTIDRMND